MSTKKVHREALVSNGAGPGFYLVRITRAEGRDPSDRFPRDWPGTLCGTESENRTYDARQVTCVRCLASSYVQEELRRPTPTPDKEGR